MEFALDYALELILFLLILAYFEKTNPLLVVWLNCFAGLPVKSVFLIGYICILLFY